MKTKKITLNELKKLIKQVIKESNEYPGGFDQDSISKAKSNAFREHNYEKDAIESVGGIDKWNKLSKKEQDEIIEFEKKSWERSHRMG